MMSRARSRAGCGFRYRHLKPQAGAAESHRTKTLEKMGFYSFRSYLRSELWQSIKSVVMANCGHRCEICGDFATEVHHLDYRAATLKGHKPSKLIGLCSACLCKIEYRFDGQKRPFEASNKALRRILRRKGLWERFAWRFDPDSKQSKSTSKEAAPK